MPYRIELEKVYTDLFDQLGYDFSLKTYPVSRGLAMLEAGLVDGDCSRSESLLDNSGNVSIVRVGVVIRSTDYGVWSHSADLESISILDLKKQNYRIGYSKGSVVVEQFFRRHDLTNVVAIEGLSNGLRMLSANRFDLFLVGNGLVYEQENTMGLRSPIYMGGIVFRDHSYLYLHKKHEKLRDVIERKLAMVIQPGGVPVKKH